MNSEGGGRVTLHPNKYIDFLLKLLYLAVIGIAVYLVFRYALPWLAPLIIAYLLSCIIARPVNFLSRKKILPRKLASGIFTLLIVTLAALLVWWLGSALISEGVSFVNSLPSSLSSLADQLNALQSRLDTILQKLPAWLQGTNALSLESWLQNIKLPQIDVSAVATSLWGAASSLPMAIITVVFVIMSTYFLTAQRTEVVAFLQRQVGAGTFAAGKQLKDFLFGSVWKWCKAQLILICITFCVLSLGFLIIHQPYVLLLAVCIAVIDALPILGVGTVLIPWALYDLLTASFRHAIGLLLIYAAVLMVRNAIEPRIVGGQLGLHPFVTLLCLYFGFRTAGFMGLFLLPVTVLCLIKLREWGYIKLWR